jgi:predicted GH43/DUF377 family glycosyl hydrolase
MSKSEDLLVVIPVSQADSENILRNLELSHKMDRTLPFSLLLSSNGQVRPEMLSEIREASEKAFAVVHECLYPLQNSDSKDWSIARNRAWQNAARHVESNLSAKHPFWFFWEPDAAPIRPGWLSRLQSAHVKGRKPFSGYVCLDAYMHGTAIWPSKLCDSIAGSGALYVTNFPFDKTAALKTKNAMNQLNGTILSFKKAYGDGLALHSDPTAIHGWIGKHPETVLLLECSDGEIQDWLLGRQTAISAQEAEKPSPYPSFTEQTDWPSSLFCFPNLPGTCFFNCSVAMVNDQPHLFARRWRYKPDNPEVPIIGYGSDLTIWRIRENMTLAARPIIPETPNRYPGEQWEDPRAVLVDGRIYVSFATWIYNSPWPIRQSFTRLSESLNKIEVLWEPDYGGNASSPFIAKSHEKNWVWFHYSNAWHCVYKPEPQIVFRVDSKGSVTKEWKSTNTRLPWNYGPLRGSTPPVLLPGGGEYLCFFHSALLWRGPKRRYFMGAYTFKSKPPFAPVRMTTEPLLSGSEEDFRMLNSPLVIFPAGALLLGGTWLVTFGMNDEHCGWIKIPVDDLESTLKPIS